MTETAPPPPFSTLARHAARYGGIGGGIGVVWMLADHALGFQTTRPDIGRISDLAALIVPVAATIIGVMHWRDRVTGGTTRFSAAFGVALAIGLVFSTLMAVGSWLHATVIDPDLIPARIEAVERAMRQAEMPEEEIRKNLDLLHEHATPNAYAFQRFAGSLIQSLIIALMAGVSVRKKPFVALPRTREDGEGG